MQQETELKHCIKKSIEDRRYELGLKAGRLNGVSPLEKLRQGYSYAEDSEGKNIRSIGSVSEGDAFSLYVTDGCISGVVTGTKER